MPYHVTVFQVFDAGGRTLKGVINFGYVGVLGLEEEFLGYDNGERVAGTEVDGNEEHRPGDNDGEDCSGKET